MNASRQMLAKICQVVCIGGVIVTAMLIGQTSAAAESEGANVLFILDGSGSMWGRLENVEKIVIAKKRMTEWVQDWENANMGLIVYGHRRKGDCDDIEMLTSLGPGNQERIITQIQSINPKGKTPIQRSIALAAQHLETLEDETSIVLVSDGLETCDPDPCGYVKRLKDEKGIAFTLDVVGFDVKDDEREQLECLANAGGGRYYSAKNAMQLKEAFTEVKKEVVKKVEATPAGPQPGDVWTEPVTGMEFVWIPGGCFQMGQTEQEKKQLLSEVDDENYQKWFAKELPQHQVCVDGFWMAKYEVTQTQWQKIMGNNPSSNHRGDSRPVEHVSWNTVQEFISTLNPITGETFRLPTEAEWEYACRAGTQTTYYFGNDSGRLGDYAWYSGNATETHPVGQRKPNAWGLYDMLGNAWEWTEDIYREDSYQTHQRNNPLVVSGGSRRLYRGGGWDYTVSYVRCAYRDFNEPSFRHQLLGFRLVRTP